MHAGMHSTASLPIEAGQGAFAAIAEIVLLLQAEPETDWSKVDIGSLREHLVDMNELTLNAVAREQPIPGGLQIEITGEGRYPAGDSQHGARARRRTGQGRGLAGRCSRARDGARLT